MTSPSSHQRQLPLLLVIFIDTYGYFLVLPVLLQLFMNLHGTLLPPSMTLHARHWLYSITLALSPLAFITLSPLVGWLSDRYGRKNIIAGSLIASVLGFSLPVIGILTHHVSLILIGRFIAGAGTTSQPVAQAAMTDITTGKKRAIGLGLIGFAMTLSMVLGPVSGAYLSNPHLVHWFNATTPFAVGILITLINLVFLCFCFTETINQTASHPSPTKNKPTFKLISPFIFTLIIAFCFMEINWSLYYQVSFLLFPTYYAQNTNQVSLFATACGFWMSLGLTIGFRCLLQFFSINKIALATSAIIALCLGLLMAHPSMHFHWLYSAPIALCIGILYPALLQLITEHTPAEHQGWMLGIASTILGFAWMLTGLFSGQIIDTSATLSIELSFLSAIFTVVFIILFQQLKSKTNLKADYDKIIH